MLGQCKSNSLAPHMVGDPVDVMTGANIDQSFEFRLTGPLEFRWHRNYDSSKVGRRYAMGWGHTHDYERSLHFDSDGMRYQYPVGKAVGFPPLLGDGDEVSSNGYVLFRVSRRVYQLRHHGEDAMEFEFHDPARPANLKRIFRDKDQIRFFYTAKGQLKGIVDSDGRKIKVVTTPEGLVSSLSVLNESNQPMLLLVGYSYDDNGNLLETTNHEGHGHKFSYDQHNRLTSRTGRTGFSFYFQYDNQGRCTKAVGDRRTHGVSLDYDIPGSVTKVTRADLGVWNYFFDESGLTQIIDPLGGNQVFVHDDSGRLVSELDTNGNETQYIYSESGALIAKMDPLGNRVLQPEDPNAPDPRRVRVAANPAEYQWGRLLDLKRLILPTAEQRNKLQVSPKSKALVRTSMENGAIEKFRRDYEVLPLGVIWWPKPNQGRVFNDLGKLVSQFDEQGKQREWTYDASGNLARHVDFDGKEWIYQYRHWHFLTSRTDPLGNEIKINYSPEGEISKFEDAGGTATEFKYDLKNNLIEVKRHGVVRETYVRDTEGNLIAKQATDGRELLKIEIGPGNLPVRRVLASGEEHRFEYDQAGRQLAANTKKHLLQFAYDKFGNRISEICNGMGVVHQFSGTNSLEKSVIFNRFTVQYCYATAAVVIVDPTGGKHSVKSHANGVVELVFANGTSEISQFDYFGRCLFKNKQTRDQQHNWTRQYHWSGEGELLAIKDNQRGDVTHSYDEAHRLKGRTIDGEYEDYVFDNAGNLLSQPGLDGVSLGSGNRLETANGFKFTYNDRNHIETRETNGGRVRYHYDSRDQLVEVETPKGVFKAEYDALGHRVRKIWNGEETQYFWNHEQLIAELDNLGGLRLYIYQDSLALTPLLIVEYDSISADPSSGKVFTVFSDQLGSPQLVQNEHGQDVWQCRMLPFGGVEEPVGEFQFAFRFPGHFFDPEIELHYNFRRYYCPVLGRYIQSDPWGILGGANVYAYRMNPLLESDVRGLGEEDTPACRVAEEDSEGNWISPVTGETVEGAPNLVEYHDDNDTFARYYLDDQGRIIRAEGMLDPPADYTKEGVSHVLPEGYVSGRDHRGHLVPERHAANQDSVNVPENVIAEHGRQSNLSTKKRWENQAGAHAEADPGSWSVHEPQYEGDNTRPSSVKHSVIDSNGDSVPGLTQEIDNPE